MAHWLRRVGCARRTPTGAACCTTARRTARSAARARSSWPGCSCRAATRKVPPVAIGRKRLQVAGCLCKEHRKHTYEVWLSEDVQHSFACS